MNKKSQELTFNTIIIAVLALIILGILLFLAYEYIWGRGSELGELTRCEARGAGAACKEECNTDDIVFYMYGGCGKGDNVDNIYCCVPNS